jgi:hypothetical protein
MVAQDLALGSMSATRQIILVYMTELPPFLATIDGTPFLALAQPEVYPLYMTRQCNLAWHMAFILRLGPELQVCVKLRV